MLQLHCSIWLGKTTKHTRRINLKEYTVDSHDIFFGLSKNKYVHNRSEITEQMFYLEQKNQTQLHSTE